MKGMGDMMRQAQVMHRKMQKIQEEMENTTVEAAVGGGMVKVEVTGGREVRSITIDPSVVDPNDVDMLQDLVLSAVNEGLKKAKDMSEREMQALTGGVNIPGMF